MNHLNNLIKSSSYVNDLWLDQNETFDVINPATNQVITQVSNCGQSEVELAISSAKDALSAWSVLSANERSVILERWYDLVISNQETLAEILTLEQGKPLTEAKGEINYGASYIKWFAEEGKRIYGDIIPSASSNTKILVQKQPVGVVASITPWNFPNAMILRKAAAA